MVFANSVAFAQTAQDTDSASPATASPGAAPKAKSKPSDKKSQGSQPAKAASADAKPKTGQYATEAEARSHCRGGVVWVDKDHFNHYAGSREYGRKPGAFACENG
jgi:hypothetical protein